MPCCFLHCALVKLTIFLLHFSDYFALYYIADEKSCFTHFQINFGDLNNLAPHLSFDFSNFNNKLAFEFIFLELCENEKRF